MERKWRTENSFAGGRRAVIKRINEPRKKVIILSVDLSRRLLETATPETLPFWAIALFAGLRPESEICRLMWDDIDFEQQVIVVDGAALALKSLRYSHQTAISSKRPATKCSRAIQVVVVE